MIATKANIQANRTSTKQNPNVPFLYKRRTFSGVKNPAMENPHGGLYERSC